MVIRESSSLVKILAVVQTVSLCCKYCIENVGCINPIYHIVSLMVQDKGEITWCLTFHHYSAALIYTKGLNLE